MIFIRVLKHNIIAAFLTQSVAVDTGTVKFEIWDTAGQGAHAMCE